MCPNATRLCALQRQLLKRLLTQERLVKRLLYLDVRLSRNKREVSCQHSSAMRPINSFEAGPELKRVNASRQILIRYEPASRDAAKPARCWCRLPVRGRGNEFTTKTLSHRSGARSERFAMVAGSPTITSHKLMHTEPMQTWQTHHAITFAP